MHGIFFHICHRRRSRGQGPHVLVPKNTCKGILDNKCDIGDFRAHIFCPQTTQELYLRSTMKQDRLNNCLVMYCHKSITDTLATMKTAKRFACANEQRKGLLKKNLSRGMTMAEWKMSALPPPPRIAISSFWTTGASFARDVTAAILVVKNKSISLRGETLFSSELFGKIDHQHEYISLLWKASCIKPALLGGLFFVLSPI